MKKIQDLQKLLEAKDLEINNLRNNLINANNNTITSINQGEKIIAVLFNSTKQDINRPISCKNTDTFARIEEKIYNEYPKYKDYNTYLTVNGNMYYNPYIQDIHYISFLQFLQMYQYFYKI